ncbi:MAG: hypothetical protein AAGD14_00945 [Planctomycetota bacterium]
MASRSLHPLDVDADVVLASGPHRATVQARGKRIDVRLSGLGAALKLRKLMPKRASQLLRAADLEVVVRLWGLPIKKLG